MKTLCECMQSEFHLISIYTFILSFSNSIEVNRNIRFRIERMNSGGTDKVRQSLLSSMMFFIDPKKTYPSSESIKPNIKGKTITKHEQLSMKTYKTVIKGNLSVTNKST